MPLAPTDLAPLSQAEIPATIEHADASPWIRFRRLQHLGIVLAVSLAHPIVGSTYVLLGGTSSTSPLQQDYRLVAGLVSETTSLLLLWYVMSKQGKSWGDIGWKVRFTDIPRAIGLFMAALIVPVFVSTPVQYVYWAFSGHWLAPKSLHAILGFGISFLSIAFACVNPFFEELIVRGYAMSEVMGVGGSAGLAIVVSVAVQLSYHLYQGLAHAIALAAVFTILSIYYAQTRNIVPVVFAHLLLDVTAVLRGGF
jgi:membrane protease YdiL (CAAX protease family)